MPIQLVNNKTEFVGGKNILASSHVQFKEVGGTLDAAKFPAGKVEVGQALARSESTGKYEPYTTTTGFNDFVILNVDFINDQKTDVHVGELIVRGTVYEKKLKSVDANFKAKTPMIRYV